MNTSTIIKPTIGRKLWFWPGINDHRARGLHQEPSTPPQPCDATVIYVRSDHMVSLLVTDHAGMNHHYPSVPIAQAGCPPISFRDGYACWMPHQTAQAAKQAEPAAEPAKPFVAFLHTDGSSEHYEGAALFASDITDPGIDFDENPPTFAVLGDGRTTVCQLTLRNGFTVTGQSIAMDINRFNMLVGRDLALADARANAEPFLACIAKEREYLTRNGSNTGFDASVPF